ncbi:MAG: competence protein ComEC, partial [Pseudomonas sp.]|nr:competence protein ComEC [Pseudomonas sp.]
SSSSMVFLRAVAPRAVLLSRGRQNAYGHPHPRVLARYQAIGAQLYDNVPSGALRIQLGRYAPAQGWREQRRFWR